MNRMVCLKVGNLFVSLALGKNDGILFFNTIYTAIENESKKKGAKLVNRFNSLIEGSNKWMNSYLSISIKTMYIGHNHISSLRNSFCFKSVFIYYPVANESRIWSWKERIWNQSRLEYLHTFWCWKLCECVRKFLFRVSFARSLRTYLLNRKSLEQTKEF